MWRFMGFMMRILPGGVYNDCPAAWLLPGGPARVSTGPVYRANNWKRWICTVWIAVFLAWTGDGYAALYRCKDAAGHSVFQDRICTGALLSAEPAKAAEPAKEAESPDARHFFWKASRAGATIYLLGSIHLGTPAMYPMPAVVTSAFQASSALVVEADLTSAAPAEVAAGLLAIGQYGDGSLLQHHIEPSLWESYKNAMQSFGGRLEMVARAKPWFAAQILEIAAMQQAGFDSRLGIDLHFIQRAKHKVPIFELESVDEQFAMLDGLPAEQQALMLEQAVKQFSQAGGIIGALLKSWKTGDAEAMEKLIVQDAESDPRNEPMLRRLIYDRNRSMAEKLLTYAKPGQACFVVVGAAHMVGDQGLVALLRRQGFDVQQL